MKPTTCPICGCSWLAEYGGPLSNKECLGCGAWIHRKPWGRENWVWTKEEIDARQGPIALTRNAHTMSKEGLNRLLDELGFGGGTIPYDWQQKPPETP